MPMLRGAYVKLHDLISLAAFCSPRVLSIRGSGRHAGDYQARSKGRGLDLDEVRLYQPGDDIRSIDWKVTARKNVAHTKVFHEERERPTLVVVDQTQSMFFGSNERLKSVAAAEVTARIAWQTLASRDRIGGVTIGNNGLSIVKPFRSGKTVARLLRSVADANNALAAGRFSTRPVHELWEAVPIQIRRIAHVNYRIYFISDFTSVSEHALQSLLALSRHNQITLIFVFDELERELPPANRYHVTDGESDVTFNSAGQQNRSTYRKRFDARSAGLADLCRRYAVPYLTLSTAESCDTVRFYG